MFNFIKEKQFNSFGLALCAHTKKIGSGSHHLTIRFAVMDLLELNKI